MDIAKIYWAWLDDVIGPVDEDFELAVADQPSLQERQELDFFG